jgi:hypothetical protein
MPAPLISYPPRTFGLSSLKCLTISLLGHSGSAHSHSFFLLERLSSLQFRDASGEKILSRNLDGGGSVNFFIAAFRLATAQEEDPDKRKQ